VSTLPDYPHALVVISPTGLEWVHSLHGTADSVEAMRQQLAGQSLQSYPVDLRSASSMARMDQATARDLTIVLDQAIANGLKPVLADQESGRTIIMRISPLSIAHRAPANADAIMEASASAMQQVQDAVSSMVSKKSADVMGARLVALHLFVQAVARESDGEHRSMKRDRLEELATIACEAGEVFDRIADQTFNPTMPDLGRTGPDERNLPRK
jgi:hypothetical protein